MVVALLWILALVLAVIAAGVMTPVHLSLRVETTPRPRLRIGAAAFGGLAPPVFVYDSAARKPDEKPSDEDGAKRKARVPPRGMPAGAGRAFARLADDLLRRVRFKHLVVDAGYGLGDPADTGQLCGLLAPLTYGVQGRRNITVALRPDFGRATLTGYLDVAVKVTPAALVPPFTRFVWALWWPGK